MQKIEQTESAVLYDHFQSRLLSVFYVYRLILAFVLIYSFLLYQYGNSTPALAYSKMNAAVLLLYLCFAVATAVIGYRKFISPMVMTLTVVFIDTLLLTILIMTNPHALIIYGVLVNIVIAAGSVMTSGRMSFLFAAAASLMALVVEALGHKSFVIADMQQAGILGLIYFITATVAYLLSYRLKQSEALVRKQAAKMASLQSMSNMVVKQLHAGIIVVDVQGHISLINELAKELLKLEPDSESLYLPDLAADLWETLSAWRLKSEDHTLAYRSFPGYLPHFSVLTESKLTEELRYLVILDDAQLLSKQAQQAKLAALGRLTASIAHEIRNPLSAIAQASELLGEMSIKREGEEDLQTESALKRLTAIIQTHTIRVNTIIENVLRLSRRQSASMQPLLLNAFLSTLITEWQAAEKIHIAPVLSLPTEDIWVQVDQGQLQQILINLLMNAWRYASRGVKPRIELKLILEGTDIVRLFVFDNGAGIDKAQIPFLFEPFYTTEASGSGLGLYIAKQLAEVNYIHLDSVSSPLGGAGFSLIFKRNVG